MTWCGIVFGVVFIYLYVFGVSTWFIIIEGRNLSGKDDPSLWETPVALKDLSISKAPGRKLSYLGYEFEVPWDDLDEQKTRLVGKWQVISFHSGESIVFSTPPPNGLVNSFFEEGGADKRAWSRFLGAETIQSDYAFIRAALETAPGDIGLLTPRGAAARTIFLLLMKSIQIIANDGESGIFLIETKDFHGFQYGNPAAARPKFRPICSQTRSTFISYFQKKSGQSHNQRLTASSKARDQSISRLQVWTIESAPRWQWRPRCHPLS